MKLNVKQIAAIRRSRNSLNLWSPELLTKTEMPDRFNVIDSAVSIVNVDHIAQINSTRSNNYLYQTEAVRQPKLAANNILYSPESGVETLLYNNVDSININDFMIVVVYHGRGSIMSGVSSFKNSVIVNENSIYARDVQGSGTIINVENPTGTSIFIRDKDVFRHNSKTYSHQCTTGNYNFYNGLHFGALYASGAAPDDSFQGQIFEITFIKRGISNDKLMRYEASIAHNLGFADRLDDSNIYKSNAPRI